MALISFVGAPHGGDQKLLPEWQSQRTMTPTTIVDHSIVGSALGAWTMFRDQTGIESHFIIRGRRSGAADGFIWQLMDTGREADANLNANRFGLSIETEDDGDPNVQPWTSAQLRSLAWLHNKLHAVHPTIPRKRCTSCFGGGLGYHSMCGTTSSNPWTPSIGKTCPGKPVRVQQFDTILVPHFLAGTIPGEDEMTDAQMAELKKAMATAQDTTVRRVLWGLVHDISDRGWVQNDPGYGDTAALLKLCNLPALRSLLMPLQDDEGNIMTAIAAIQAGDPGPLIEEIRKLPEQVRLTLKEAL